MRRMPVYTEPEKIFADIHVIEEWIGSVEELAIRCQELGIKQIRHMFTLDCPQSNPASVKLGRLLLTAVDCRNKKLLYHEFTWDMLQSNYPQHDYDMEVAERDAWPTDLYKPFLIDKGFTVIDQQVWDIQSAKRYIHINGYRAEQVKHHTPVQAGPEKASPEKCCNTQPSMKCNLPECKMELKGEVKFHDKDEPKHQNAPALEPCPGGNSLNPPNPADIKGHGELGEKWVISINEKQTNKPSGKRGRPIEVIEGGIIVNAKKRKRSKK